MKQAWWWQYDTEQGLCVYIYVVQLFRHASKRNAWVVQLMSMILKACWWKRRVSWNCKRRLAQKGIKTEVTWWSESEMGRVGTWTMATRAQALENKGTCYCIEILPRLLWWEYCKYATLAFGDAHIIKTKSANFWRPLSLPRRQNFLIQM